MIKITFRKVYDSMHLVGCQGGYEGGVTCSSDGPPKVLASHPKSYFSSRPGLSEIDASGHHWSPCSIREIILIRAVSFRHSRYIDMLEVTAFQSGKLSERIRACWDEQPCFISATPRNDI